MEKLCTRAKKIDWWIRNLVINRKNHLTANLPNGCVITPEPEAIFKIKRLQDLCGISHN